MQKNMLVQKQIDRLDEIAKKCGSELHMPPLDNQIHPFFALKKKDNSDCLIKSLAESKFNYSVTNIGNKMYILIKG